MSRQQLVLRLTAAQVPHAEAVLDLAGAEAIELADAGDHPVLEPNPDETPLWPDVILRAQFPPEVDLAPLRELLATALGGAEHAAVAVLDDDAWRGALRGRIPARAIGSRLWLAPTEGPPAPAGRIDLRLHMGLAFGTGDHPTTSLCLDWLEAHLQRGATVLDYGCGSGVLAIAALALGAERAWAVDNDHQAVTATGDNALLNHATQNLWIGLPHELPPVTVDVVVANILAGPLVALAPTLAAHLAPGGAIVLAGLLDWQVERVTTAYRSDFENVAITIRDGWARVDARRRLRDSDGKR